MIGIGLVAEYYAAQTVAGRDRLLQRHLAQARGPRLNAALLRTSTNTMLRARRCRAPMGGPIVAEDPLIDALRETIRALEGAGVPYLLTGSLVSGVYGEPIVSQDVDIVVLLDEQQARRLASLLPPRFYRAEETLAAIGRDGGIANLIDNATGLKVDLSNMRPSPFRDALFARGCRLSFGTADEFDAVSPEDIILMKLDWRRDSQSTKQWENALSVVRARGASLDWKYLFAQARALGIEDDLVRLRDEGGV
jgi:hypothetical protein